ncbi:MAG: pentapeptide repeat-containing protein [Acidobacteriota bacterium]
MTKPHCQLLRQERVDEFNRVAANETPDLADANLRGCDLRAADLKTADLRGAYLRAADLRGVDLSSAMLDGASIHEAKVSGVLFPADFDAAEIRLSIEYGTRLRSVVSRAKAIGATHQLTTSEV